MLVTDALMMSVECVIECSFCNVHNIIVFYWKVQGHVTCIKVGLHAACIKHGLNAQGICVFFSIVFDPCPCESVSVKVVKSRFILITESSVLAMIKGSRRVAVLRVELRSGMRVLSLSFLIFVNKHNPYRIKRTEQNI